ncbi:MAG: UbiX family flavin prenyltransferase [Alistipes sp.]|nr:UbiX family flavin prenyltransferase [Candidatus Alistipes equi]
MKIIIAITAASGSIYSRLLLEELIENDSVEKIGVILSEHAKEVMQYEGESIPSNDKISVYENNNLFASMASGSSIWDAMVILPCSTGTMGRIASGVSSTLIERSADVMLKERRTLILCLRETPLSLIHIKNAEKITLAGGIILPAAPSFYSHPTSIESLCRSVTQRIRRLLGLKANTFEWDD